MSARSVNQEATQIYYQEYAMDGILGVLVGENSHMRFNRVTRWKWWTLHYGMTCGVISAKRRYDLFFHTSHVFIHYDQPDSHDDQTGW